MISTEDDPQMEIDATKTADQLPLPPLAEGDPQMEMEMEMDATTTTDQLPMPPLALPPLPKRVRKQRFSVGTEAHSEFVELSKRKGWPPLPGNGKDADLEAFLTAHGLGREQLIRKFKKSTMPTIASTDGSTTTGVVTSILKQPKHVRVALLFWFVSIGGSKYS